MIWARTVANTATLNLYNYAVAGASCSKSVTEQYLIYINADVPTVLEYEIPELEADLALKNASDGLPFFPNRTPQNTVYALWIGANDLGQFSTDKNVPDTNLGNFTDCVFTCFDRLYALGARHFVLFNALPQQLTPEYQPYDTSGPFRQGVDPDGVSPSFHRLLPARIVLTHDQTTNMTALAATISNYDAAVDKIYSYAVPYYLHLAHRYPSASIILFDIHSLITDIFNNPSLSLSSPANVTGYYHHCNDNYTQCTDSSEPFDSFMWYDEGHPSQVTYDVIAREFVKALKGQSSYASCW